MNARCSSGQEVLDFGWVRKKTVSGTATKKGERLLCAVRHEVSLLPIHVVA